MVARLFAGLLLAWSVSFVAAADPPLLPTADELKAAKSLSDRQQLYCRRLVDVHRKEAEIVQELFKLGTASKDSADEAGARVKDAERRLAELKDGKPLRPLKGVEPTDFEAALARLSREEQIAKARYEEGLEPAITMFEARRQRLHLQWAFGTKEQQAAAAPELAKTLQELLKLSAALRNEGVGNKINEIEVRRELIAVSPPTDAAKERQALREHARQHVAVLQDRHELGVISRLEVYRGAAAALEALLATETE